MTPDWSLAPAGYDFWVYPVTDDYMGQKPDFHRRLSDGSYEDINESFWPESLIKEGVLAVIERPAVMTPVVTSFAERHAAFVRGELCSLLVAVANDKREVERAVLFHQEQEIRSRYGTWS